MIIAFLPTLCALIGIPKSTNHGLRRTGISLMWRAGISIKDIMLRSRHRSLDAVMKYMK
jgi:integrase